MKKIFTGYVIADDFDLNVLPIYGFTKTWPKETNPWWQCWFGFRCASQLLVSKDDRKLLMAYDEGCDLTRLNNTLQEMKEDGILVSIEEKE